jgi:hypothetical protein
MAYKEDIMTDLKNVYREQAKYLPYNYETAPIEDMLSNYKKYRNTPNPKANHYFSGLMLRFWYLQSKLEFKYNITLKEDRLFYHDMVVDTINLTTDYWDEEKGVKGTQAINKCASTIMLREMYQRRLDIHKASYKTTSIDTPVAGDEDGMTIGDTLIDDNGDPMSSTISGANCLIQHYIDENKIVEAIILDTIAYNDTFKHTRKQVKTVDEDGDEYKFTEHSTEFWAYKVVQLLGNLSAQYITHFLTAYEVDEKILMVGIDAIHKANNQKLYKYLSNTLKSCKPLVSTYLM